jgi:two-component system OmpR family response regulator
MKETRLLLAEDDPNLGMVLQSYLEMNEIATDLFSDGKQALHAFRSGRYTLCVLDIMMPGMDGLKLAEEIRKTSPETPFIFLTAKSLKADIVSGYQTGADDYITKPFEPDVLVLKIRAILRRKGALRQLHGSTPEKIGSFVFYPDERLLVSDDHERKLSPREASLLAELIKNKNTLLKREDALVKIWGNDSYFNARSMDVYISKLRQYLASDTAVSIINVHGAGYRMVVKD